ncbi:hypothetical protein Tco_0530355 [Tanacetum coccineum]
MNMKEVIKTYRESSTNLLNISEMLRVANVPGLMHTLDTIQNTLNTHVNHHATLVESYRPLAWNAGPRLTKIKPSQESFKSDIASLKIDIVIQVDPIQSIIPTTTPVITEVITLITTITLNESNPITEVGGSSIITPKVDKGKGIAIETDPSPPKLVKASRKAHLDKKEKMEHDMKEAELSKPEIVKVAVELVNEVEVQILGSKEFLKH